MARGLELTRTPPSRARRALTAWSLIALLAPGCRHLERATPGREPCALPPDWVDPYRPRHPGFNLRLEPWDDCGGAYQSYRLTFDTFSEIEGDFKRLEGRFYRSREVPAGEKTPLLLISPILAGAVDDYLACRVFARWACAEGLSAFYLHQEESILEPERDGVDFERLMRDNIQDNIKALDLFLTHLDVDPRRLGSLGISMGALKNVVLVAVEPRLVANVLCLVGADLPKILLESKEPLVVRYLRERQARDGMTAEEIAAELRRNFRAEPGRYAEAVTNDRVILFLGSLDNKVPYCSGELLEEKLGEPEAYIIPLGHYTSIIAAPFTAGSMFRFLRDRFGM